MCMCFLSIRVISTNALNGWGSELHMLVKSTRLDLRAVVSEFAYVCRAFVHLMVVLYRSVCRCSFSLHVDALAGCVVSEGAYARCRRVHT
jgi:hypothetical protein